MFVLYRGCQKWYNSNNSSYNRCYYHSKMQVVNSKINFPVHYIKKWKKYSDKEVYRLRKYGRESAEPQPALGKLNSRIIRITPIISPSESPQKAPDSVVLSQNIAITKTTAIGGQRKLVTLQALTKWNNM